MTREAEPWAGGVAADFSKSSTCMEAGRPVELRVRPKGCLARGLQPGEGRVGGSQLLGVQADPWQGAAAGWHGVPEVG